MPSYRQILTALVPATENSLILTDGHQRKNAKKLFKIHRYPGKKTILSAMPGSATPTRTTCQITLRVKYLFDREYREYTFDLSGLAGLAQDFYIPPR